jgi:hypothetical protein
VLISERLRSALWCAVACVSWSCAAAAPSAPAAPALPQEEPLQLGALTDFVPAAGLRWLVAGSPRYFAQHPALAGLRQRWLTDQRLDSFAQATAVDLRTTERALIAGFDLGTLYLTDGSGWVRSPQEPFIERLAGSARVQRPHRHVWRITGLAGSTPQALVRLDDAVLAVAVRDPLLARDTPRCARGRLRDVTPALQGAALSVLPAELVQPGPLRVYALGPFSPQSLPEGAGLLAAASAVAAALELDGQWLSLRLVLAGVWDETQDGEHLRALWQALLESPLGHTLGLSPAREEVRVQASAQHLQLATTLDAERVLAGLERLAEGRLEALLGPAAEPHSLESPR